MEARDSKVKELISAIWRFQFSDWKALEDVRNKTLTLFPDIARDLKREHRFVKSLARFTRHIRRLKKKREEVMVRPPKQVRAPLTIEAKEWRGYVAPRAEDNYT